MQKFVAILSLLLLTSHVFAATLSSNIIKAFKNHGNSTTHQKSTIIYGGKDITREVADANEPFWSGEPVLIG